MCQDCDWESALDLAEEMIFDDEFEFARDTVNGIYEWVKENEHVTEAQMTALENIYGSKR